MLHDLRIQGYHPWEEGHEALMLTNLNDEKATIELVIVFEDREPETGIMVELDGMMTVIWLLFPLNDMLECLDDKR